MIMRLIVYKNICYNYVFSAQNIPFYRNDTYNYYTNNL